MAVEKNYESEDFLIVNKPYDMYINSDDENEKNTLTCHIAKHDSHLSTSSNPLHFVQRLDYSTSGVICIAKSKSAAAQAGKLFEKRLTKKYYLAVVRNHVKFGLADIKYSIGVDLSPGNSHKMVALTAGTECGVPRAAHTRLLLLETGSYCGDPVSVVLLKPITGRRHQLRAHCRAVGHTILGDYTYSAPVDCSPHRMFLHATRLVLPLPQHPLDIQTSEPFFSDPQFTCKFKSTNILYKYRSKDDFIAACDVIDKSYTIGIKSAIDPRLPVVQVVSSSIPTDRCNAGCVVSISHEDAERATLNDQVLNKALIAPAEDEFSNSVFNSCSPPDSYLAIKW